MNTSTNNKYWLLSCSLFSFFLTWSFGFSLFPIWLSQTIGLTGEQTGIIFSISALAALAVMPCYGYIQDKLGLGKGLLITVGVLLFLSGPFFIFVYGPLLISNFYLGAVLGAIFFSAAFSAGVGAVETYVERVSRTSGFEYGKARMWGSLGWAAATLFAGVLFNINPQYNFILASISACIFLLSIALLKVNTTNNNNLPTPKDNEVNFKDAIKILTLKEFWGFATFIMGVSCVYGVYDQQFPVYFSSLFPTKEEGNAMYGYLNSLQVFLEAAGMFLAPFIVNKIGAKNGLLLSGIIMAIRIVGSGFADDTVTISIMKLLHAAELPIMLVAIFKYISITFDNKYSATIYIVGFQFMSQVIASALSIIVGAMYDTIGFPETYKILGIIVSVFVVISYFSLGNFNHTKQTSLQPNT
ncbi:oligosaccharide MFS transporter [Colwellia sp. E150_009]